MAGFGTPKIGLQYKKEIRLAADETARLALTGLNNGDLIVQLDTSAVYVYDSTTSTFKTIGGGATKVADAAALAALSPEDGDLAIQLDTNELWQYDLDTVSWLPVGGVSSVSDTDSVDLTIDAGVLTADVIPAGVDHDSLANTHNLTTDIDHDQLTNFSSDEHFTESSIDHTAIQNIGSNSHSDIDDHIADTNNPHDLYAVNVKFPNDGGASTPANLYGIINHVASSFIATGFDLTDNLDGTVDMAEGAVVMRTGSDEDSLLEAFGISAQTGT